MGETTRNCAIDLGRQGEAFTAGYYQDQGYYILDMNCRYSCGELDLVARSPEGEYVFIEVKTRSTPAFGGAEAVDRGKLRKMRRAAAKWLEGKPAAGVRFDVVVLTVVGGYTGMGEVEHIFFDIACYEGVEDGAC